MNRKTPSRILLTLLLISAFAAIPMTVYAQDHDVAVTDVKTFKSLCGLTLSPFDIVYENYTLTINATVENHGTSSESFDVVGKYDDTVFDTVATTLAIGEIKNVTLEWDTHDVAKGTYNIIVNANLTTDEYPDDNTYEYGAVTVTWLGDQDGNLELDPDDFWYLCAYFITYYKPGKGYLDRTILFDFNEDCIINEDDLFIFSESWINYYTSP